MPSETFKIKALWSSKQLYKIHHVRLDFLYKVSWKTICILLCHDFVHGIYIVKSQKKEKKLLDGALAK